MHSQQIQKLIDAVRKEFGEIHYFGSSKEERHGVGFAISDVKATFSISTLGGDLKSSYDIQVEGIPAGEYIFTNEVSLGEFLNLVKIFRGPESEWL
ncbi:hypothetical protein EUZ85_14225 [Hahella sp. KA22]|uniref:hypothetical protein n=1 Tax=Hahella sp. KA22 TaxID=1628392 RepID=UPI000FDF103D|nr:hypothetical protein [Hahella sp. KA22]AZZ91823.1 hypothetical protein ENC22_11665 [Hahella sp. KA22]QAY55193.1 hypothetical protein EUZ85_14225 [Hahella sp. KA22]